MKRLFLPMAVFMMVFGSVNLFAQNSERMQKVSAVAQQRFQKDDETWFEPTKTNFSQINDDNGVKEYFQVEYTYDEYEFFLTEEVEQKKAGDYWVNNMMKTYEYDWMGNVSSCLEQEWENGAWVNSTMTTFTYDEFEGTPQEVIVKVWVNGAWVNEERIVYTYGDDVTYMLFCDWSGVWNSDEMYTITYEMEGYEIIEQYMEHGAWQNEYRTLVAYNENFDLGTKLSQIWEDNSWVNDAKLVYNYDENGFYNKIELSAWISGDWSEVGKIDYVFSNGNAISASFQYMEAGEWTDDENFEIEMPYANNERSKTFEATEVAMVYNDFLNVDEMTENGVFGLYPNPAVDVIAIQGEGFEKAEIFNIAGQKVMEANEARIDVNSLNSGVYMVKVYGNGSSEMLRVVVK